MSHRDIAIELAHWIVWDHPNSVNVRIRLFDSPSLILRELPEDKLEATLRARQTLELYAKRHQQFRGREVLVMGILGRIDFLDSEDGEEEYPVLRPRPDSLIPHWSSP